MSTPEKNELFAEGDNWSLAVYLKDLDITKAWLIQLNYTNPDTDAKFRDQYRKGLNYYRTLASRTKEAKGLMNAFQAKLKSG